VSPDSSGERFVQTNTRASVLIVDDEDMVITSLRAYLQLETDYHVEGITDPENAAQYLTKNTVDVVISDYLMPRMNGIQLLAQAKKLQPEATRVLLTGHADKQSAIQAINEVSLYQYVEKPWENAQLLLVIQNGIERAQLLRSLKDVNRRLLQAFM
jgi:DNA-binding NtrC family response regulator